MLQISSKTLKKHYTTIKDEVFFVDKKWPHFEILFDDIVKLSKRFRKNKNILSIERGGLYGNVSLFAPFFYRGNFVSVDCSEKKIRNRGAYNKNLVINKNIIKIPIDIFSNYKNLKFKENTMDLIIIPNLMHHIYDHNLLIKKCSKILKKGGYLYIFEPTLREIHQKPCDYFRFTPYGLSEVLKQNNFKNIRTNYSGGPFSAMAYCWDQAMQYLPKKIKNKYKKFLIYDDIKKIINLDRKYNKNLLRKKTNFPVSFSILAKI